MKGVVFTIFNELVETQFGFETWDKMLETVQPESEGIYTAGETYPDEELFALVGELSNITEVPVPDLIHAFGEYMFPKLVSKHPVFVESQTSLKEFLMTVHDVIHVEVKKLHPDAGLPTIEYEDAGGNKLTMIYRSPRKLCFLSEGLINGAAKHFNTEVSIGHPICMHKESDHCRLELTFS